MPISINGSGTITGVAVGGLPDGTVDTDMLAANAVTEAKLGTDEQKVLAAAWGLVVSGGVSTNYNVASGSYTSTGVFSVTFTTPMPSSNYVVVGTPAEGGNYIVTISSKTTTGFVTSNRVSDTGALASIDFSFVVYA